MIYSVTIMVTAKKKKNRYPGCLAHAVIGMFSSVVANQRQPQHTYNVLQRRCQPRPTVTCICYGASVGGGEVKGGMLRRAYSFVACLSHLTIDDASLSRRSTVPTPNSLIETPPTFGRPLCVFHMLHKNCLLILSLPVSPSVATSSIS